MLLLISSNMEKIRQGQKYKQTDILCYWYHCIYLIHFTFHILHFTFYISHFTFFIFLFSVFCLLFSVLSSVVFPNQITVSQSTYWLQNEWMIFSSKIALKFLHITLISMLHYLFLSLNFSSYPILFISLAITFLWKLHVLRRPRTRHHHSVFLSKCDPIFHQPNKTPYSKYHWWAHWYAYGEWRR